MQDFTHQQRPHFHTLRFLFFLIHAYEAISVNAEVNAGAALLQISKQSKSAWSNRSSLLGDSGRMPSSFVAPQRMESSLSECCRYWQGKRKEVGGPKSASFHDIVGEDGVYVISLNCHTERFNFAAQRLKEVGITPTFFNATESTASSEQLAQGCLPQNGQCGPLREGKKGEGCAFTVEQAIADSHRRALEAAAKRNKEWTAILEDDSVPAMAEDGLWTQRLMTAWSMVPEGTDIVRLGWCNDQDPQHRWKADYNNFVIADTPDVGGCTHAYVVHRSALAKLSAIFPCCCPADCCLKFGMRDHGITMVNIDAVGSKEYIASRMTQDWGFAYGIMMQAKDALPTTQVRRR